MPRSKSTSRKQPLKKNQESLSNHLNSRLFLAIQQNQANDILDFIIKGADVHYSREGVTALHFAVALNHPECISSLLESGADVNAKTKDGYSPLYLAAESGHVHIVHALLKAKADILGTDLAGNTALHIAVQNSHLFCARELVKAGADCEVLNNVRLSPLRIAADTRQANIIREFAACGCNKAVQALARLEDAIMKPDNNGSLRSKITSFIGKATSFIDNLISPKVKDASYVFGKLGLWFAVPYVLDVPIPIMASASLLAAFSVLVISIRNIELFDARIIPDTADLSEPTIVDPQHVYSALTHVNEFAKKLKLNEVNVTFDNTEINQHNALAISDTKSIFIHNKLVKTSKSQHQLKGIIAHEMQHINKNDIDIWLNFTNNVLQLATLLSLKVDFFTKLMAAISPFKIPYLSDLIGSRSHYPIYRIAVELLVHLLDKKRQRDEEYNADNGALALTNDDSLEEHLKDTLLCHLALELTKIHSNIPQSDIWVQEGWEAKNPIPSLLGLFSMTHPPLADRIKNLQERRTHSPRHP